MHGNPLNSLAKYLRNQYPSKLTLIKILSYVLCIYLDVISVDVHDEGLDKHENGTYNLQVYAYARVCIVCVCIACVYACARV